MTNHWIDIKNSDCILIMGSNAAENHPISFKFVTEAQQKGAKLISVDPRFTRTSSKADIYAPIRSGTDIAFLGGMIKYIPDNDLYFQEYVANYTNAAFIVGPPFDFKDGLFSGYNPDTRKYDKSKWAFEMDANGIPKMDRALNDDRTVFQLLKMYKGTFKGFFAWSQNPACSGANAGKNRKAFAKLDWMVNVNLFDNETASFWEGPGVDASRIKTEVFFLPAAASVEKEGSITNSVRWSQWRYQGPKPLGNSLPDGQIIMELSNKLKAEYKKGGTFPEPVINLKCDYLNHGEYDPHKVAKEINGYFVKDVTLKGKIYKKGTLVPSFAFLQADGSTSSGNWL